MDDNKEKYKVINYGSDTISISNSTNSNLSSHKKKYSKTKFILISLAALLIPIIIAIVVVLVVKKKRKKDKTESDEVQSQEVEEVEEIQEVEEVQDNGPIGEINLEFYIEINAKENNISIFGDEFEKNSKFEVIIDGEKTDNYYINYQINKRPWRVVKILLYEDINMDNMFKSVKYLYSINMNSTKNAKVLSMKSTFENCSSLEDFNMEGFDTSIITSFNRLFYGSPLSNLNLKIDASNIEDASFMFSKSELEEIDLSQYNLNKVKNLSHIFYDSHITKINLGGIDTSQVEDMSHMFDLCDSVTEIINLNINTSKVKNMSNLFKDCISLTSLLLS